MAKFYGTNLKTQKPFPDTSRNSIANRIMRLKRYAGVEDGRVFEHRKPCAGPVSKSSQREFLTSPESTLSQHYGRAEAKFRTGAETTDAIIFIIRCLSRRFASM